MRNQTDFTLPRRPPVLIVGSHRSGTSAVTHALRLLGLHLGQPERCDHHDEAYFFLQLHDRWLHRAGGAWDAPDPLLQQLQTTAGRNRCRRWLRQRIAGRIGNRLMGKPPLGMLRYFVAPTERVSLMLGQTAWGWKDPRTSLFLPVWLQIFPEARVLHLTRHPVDVALSLQHRKRKWVAENRTTYPGWRDSLEEWLELVEIYVAAASHSGARHYQETRFEDIQRNPVALLGELAEFCGLQVGQRELTEAASTIDAERQGRWKNLPPAEVTRLLTDFAPAAGKGYLSSV